MESIHAVTEIGADLGNVADGNLACEIKELFIPALDKFRLDFNSLIKTLRNAIQTVRDNASAIDGAASDLARKPVTPARRLGE